MKRRFIQPAMVDFLCNFFFIITDKKMKVLTEKLENPRKSRAADRFAVTMNN